MSRTALSSDYRLAVRNGVQYLYSREFEALGTQHFFSTKRAPGDRTIPLGSGEEFIMVRQVHGDDILVIDRPAEDIALFAKRSRQEPFDAIITNQRNMGIGVMTADCLPVLLYDPAESVIAAVHAGWRGTIRGILPRVVDRMASVFQSKPENIHAVMGPVIGACCYTVGEAVTGPLIRMNPDWKSFLVPLSDGKARLNLSGLNRQQAEDSGLSGENISGINLCTVCHEDLFYSFRRDGVGTGRMISGIFTNL